MKKILRDVRALTPTSALALCTLGLAACGDDSDDGGADGVVLSDPTLPEGGPVNGTPPTEDPGVEMTPTEGSGEEMTPAEGEGPGEEMTPTEGPGEEMTPTEGPGEEVPEPGQSVATSTVENRDAFLANLLDILDGTRFAEIHALGDDLLDANEQRVTLVDTAFAERVETSAYDCSGGGRYVAQSSFSNVVGEIISATATDCVVSEGELDGTLFRVEEFRVSLEDFTLARPSGTTSGVVSSVRIVGREPDSDVTTEAASRSRSRRARSSSPCPARRTTRSARSSPAPRMEARSRWRRRTAIRRRSRSCSRHRGQPVRSPSPGPRRRGCRSPCPEPAGRNERRDTDCHRAEPRREGGGEERGDGSRSSRFVFAELRGSVRCGAGGVRGRAARGPKAIGWKSG